jgi:hypothetical protein
MIVRGRKLPATRSFTGRRYARSRRPPKDPRHRLAPSSRERRRSRRLAAHLLPRRLARQAAAQRSGDRMEVQRPCREHQAGQDASPYGDHGRVWREGRAARPEQANTALAAGSRRTRRVSRLAPFEEIDRPSGITLGRPPAFSAPLSAERRSAGLRANLIESWTPPLTSKDAPASCLETEASNCRRGRRRKEFEPRRASRSRRTSSTEPSCRSPWRSRPRRSTSGTGG